MSRLPHDNVWDQYHRFESSAICPVCLDKDNPMHKDDHYTWNREHIIAVGRAFKGQDIYPNLIPICAHCNQSMGIHYDHTYQYIADKFKRYTMQQATIFKDRQIAINDAFDPICTHALNSGKRCRHLKCGKDEIYCTKHKQIEEDPRPMDIGE